MHLEKRKVGDRRVTGQVSWRGWAKQKGRGPGGSQPERWGEMCWSIWPSTHSTTKTGLFEGRDARPETGSDEAFRAGSGSRTHPAIMWGIPVLSYGGPCWSCAESMQALTGASKMYRGLKKLWDQI
ncbi:predicted protein [Coccidioides posadasii str. Silveira]|uniref:Predicted protein n=1 Tax=Coccidioides posadasii (strain RMSCC 757 / Silveira) TaxID=443226 RepID=E9D6Q9_COCPS|nr:predicted protein [Coccidioides posadasii str. Silveira]